MHTDSSASITYLASASASEWIATVLIPSSRQERWMRSAISPRLAIRIFSNIRTTSSALLDQEKGLPVLHRLAVLDQDGPYGSRDVRLDLVQQFHRFDDAQRLSLGHHLAHFDERRRARG